MAPLHKAIVAVSQNGVIGKNGDLPWNLPGDLKWFRKITMGQIILMGRKTWESLPGALAGRQNWVLSNNLPGNQDIRVFKSIEEAINAAEGKAIFFIGGEQIYRQSLKFCREIYISEVKLTVEGGDAFFPEFRDEFKLKETLEDNESFSIGLWIRKD